MRQFARALLVDLKLLFRCRAFWLSLLAITGCDALALATYMAEGLSFEEVRQSGWGALYLLTTAEGGTSFKLITCCVLPVFPFSCELLREFQSKAYLPWISRVPAKSYILANYLVTLLGAGLVLLLGPLLLLAVLCLFMPIGGLGELTASAYDSLLDAGRPVAFAFLYCLHNSFTGVLYAAISFTISAFVSNLFVAYSLPVVLYFFLLQWETVITPPDFLTPQALTELIYTLDTPGATILLKCGTVAVLCLLLGTVAVLQYERRMKNG